MLAVVLCGYLAGMVFELRQPAVPPQNAELTSWLEAHNLRSGLSGYWAANVVSLTSGDRVVVRSLNGDGNLVAPTTQLAKAEWFDPSRASADFVVLYPGYVGTEPFTGFTGVIGFTETRQVLATFGKPARTYRFGQYTVLVWDKNLLTDLRSGR